jgi:chromosome segregation ATPase
VDAARIDMQYIQKELLQTTQQRDQFQKERLEALSRKQESENKWHEDYHHLERSKTKLAGEKGMLERDLARITDELRDVGSQCVRVQKDLDESMAEAEQKDFLYLNERSALNELQDLVLESLSDRERMLAELEALQRHKENNDSESSGLRRKFEEIEGRNCNLNTEISTLKNELQSVQVRLSEHDLGFGQCARRETYTGPRSISGDVREHMSGEGDSKDLKDASITVTSERESTSECVIIIIIILIIVSTIIIIIIIIRLCCSKWWL